jgi:hypothetical protein
MSVSALIRDTVEGRNIDYRLIDNISVGNLLGNWQVVAKVPVPIPDFDSAELAAIETFVVQLRPGRTYRFELYAAARSTSGWTGGVVGPWATANFYDPIVEIGLNGTPGIELVDFAIDVSSDQSQQIEELRETISSLQRSLSLLSMQFEEIDPTLSTRVEVLEDNDAMARERIDTLEASYDQLADEISAIWTQIEDARSTMESLDESLRDHTHEYLTGQGSGHNNRTATTSKPVE